VARLHVVALSARLPAWAEAACAEYAKRMPKGYQVTRSDVVPKKIRTVALDERGKDLTTVQFAELLKAETVFLIGGPDGLDAKVKADAFMSLRLSSLTLPHALAQVVLLEQIYRAATLLTGHPYHRS
jgi:23S rRNA (pseudouridine1915-N3)-methyltransferase